MEDRNPRVPSSKEERPVSRVASKEPESTARSAGLPQPSMLEVFRPLLDAARGLDLADPKACEALLRERFDPRGSAARLLDASLLALLREGTIANRGEPPVRYGRVAKSGEATHGFSIDVVHMTGPGPRHRHPSGEIDYGIALEGAPTFDGRPPGWVVFGPRSEHVPTVAGGAMLIVYLLPGGAIDFL